MIIPAILVKTFAEFAEQAKKLSFSPIIQIDVMDGQFVPNKSFEEIEKINGLNLKNEWELHLMVEHPIAELQKWKKVKNVSRVIFHFECQDDIAETIDTIKKNGFDAGLAINPDTAVEKIHPFLKDLEVVLFMTVYPGRQGAPFVPQVEKHIKKLNKILSERNYRPQLAVDGAIKKENIQMVKKWGIHNFCVGSAIIGAADPKEAFNQLNQLI